MRSNGTRAEHNAIAKCEECLNWLGCKRAGECENNTQLAHARRIKATAPELQGGGRRVHRVRPEYDFDGEES